MPGARRQRSGVDPGKPDSESLAIYRSRRATRPSGLFQFPGSPRQVKPEPGIFLEYAPINRRYDIPFDTTDDKTQKENLDALDANLEFFGAENAQALEYWLDVSLFSRWKRPAGKLPFHPELLQSDLAAYGKRGIRRVTSFAVYIDAEYIDTYGVHPLDEYGKALVEWKI